MNIGGKFLTNALKDTLSFRQCSLKEEFYVVNQIKEALCFVSLDFDADLQHSMYVPFDKIVCNE